MVSPIDLIDGEAIAWRKLVDFHLEIVPPESSQLKTRFFVHAYVAEFRGLELVKELWIDREGNVLRASVDVLNPRTGDCVSASFGSNQVSDEIQLVPRCDRRPF